MALETPDDTLQSPTNLNEMWEAIKSSWKKNLNKGYGFIFLITNKFSIEKYPYFP